MLHTLLLAAAAVQAQAGPAPLLVTTEWLAANLGAPGLVIFHIGDQRIRSTYDAGHIPGAQFLNPFTDLSAAPVEGGLRLELPGAEQLDSVLEARGVSDDSRIILYTSNEYYTPTSRALFTLEYAGLSGRVWILDGGLEAWTVENRKVSTEVPAPARGSFTPRLQRGLVVDADFLKGRLESPGLALIDARDTTFYFGAETRQGRNGHIPGARNVPFRTVIGADGKFKRTEELRTMLTAAGAAPNKTVVTYCHIGQQASLVWLSARIAGFDAKLYDGSFQDWARRTELPVVTPSLPGPIVPAEWLAANAGAPDLVVIQVERERAAYDSGHVAGARFVRLGSYSVSRNGIPAELPHPDSAVAILEAAGVSNGSRVVIVGEVQAASRLWFTLDWLGHGARAAVLDGGLEAWRAAGGAVSREAPADITRGRFVPALDPGLVLTADEVKAKLGRGDLTLIDARSDEEFRGVKVEDDLPRTGHIPGAANLDWHATLEGGRFLPEPKLRQLLTTAGAGSGELVVYCRSGMRAAVVYLVARAMGYAPKMYDGSIAEWAKRSDLPIEK